MEAVGQEKLFIGQMVYPTFPSAREVGRYPKFRIGAAELLKGSPGSTKRNETGSYNETARKFEWDSYQTEEFGLEERVDDVVAKRMENFFDAEVVTGKYLANHLMIDYERTVAAAAYDYTTFTTTHATVKYTDALFATIDALLYFNAAMERMTYLGEPPNTIIMSLHLFNLLRRSQKLQTYVYGFLNVTQGGSQITSQMLANVFGVDQVLIAKKSYDSAQKGVTPSVTAIWPDSFVAFARLAGGDFMNGGVGRTIVWDADSPGGLFTSESYRNEPRRGNMLRVRSNRVIKTVSPNCVQLIDTGASGSYIT
jgi:hypothetical protein